MGTIADRDGGECDPRARAATRGAIDPALRIAAHEMKTPLAALAGASDMLAAELDRFDADDRQLIEIIQRNSLRMIRLLDDVLLLGRIDRGELELDLRTQSLGGHVREQKRRFLRDARARSLRFEVAADLDEVSVLADEIRLARIVTALVGNATRFVKTGGHVRIEGRREGDHALLIVEDDGPGIVEEERERVFERFYRGSHETVSHGGAGLGLAIARELAEAMGGALAVEAVEPAGSRWILSLPAPS